MNAEAPDEAADNALQRNKRLAFYRRNGLHETGFHFDGGGEIYAVLSDDTEFSGAKFRAFAETFFIRPLLPEAVPCLARNPTRFTARHDNGQAARVAAAVCSGSDGLEPFLFAESVAKRCGGLPSADMAKIYKGRLKKRFSDGLTRLRLEARNQSITAGISLPAPKKSESRPSRLRR